ncbi:hypothetical protein HPB51_004164 [Rhipicephalus microplus]|uniref:Uncharacterized protein n=1 Tax=Rhipicephalus microplus TaxID=6941 RepID=A0A9J6D3J1_RHIMP|nr:hypothetical protein HPB51_004164 [Rhipicephalus microplus]
MPCNSQASSGDAATSGGRRAANATGAFKNRVVKASRMPQLPEEHPKIIIRPRGGLNLSKVSTTAIGTALIKTSGLTAQQANEDVVCPNFTQNIIVVSTSEPDNAARYVRIKSFKIVKAEYEVNAYETAPHATCKGVIRQVDIRDSQSAITTNIVHERNPLASAAKRIKTGLSHRPLQRTACAKVCASRTDLGPAEINVTGRDRLRRRPWRRQAYTRAPETAQLSELLVIPTPLATQQEQPLQVDRSAGELRIRSTWCHAGCWDHLGR